MYQWDWYRIILSLYFFTLTYIISKQLIPFPDETPKINFSLLAAAVLAFVIALQMLVNRYRLFLWVVLFGYIPFAFNQVSERIKFLEMMLESISQPRIAQLSLGVVFLALLTPKALETFSLSLKERKAHKPLFFSKGFPF